MTILRQGRWFRSAFSAHGVSSFLTAALVGAGLLLPGAGSATPPHSRTRRPLPTSLHTSRVVDTGTSSAGKRHKAAGKTKAGAHSAGTSGSAATRRAGKRAKGRKGSNEPEDPPIPMYRAGRGVAPVDRALSHRAHTGTHAPFAYGPAPLVGKSRRTGKHPIEAAAHPASRAPFVQPGPTRPMLATTHRSSPTRNTPSVEPAPYSGQPVSLAAVRPEIYAEGVSHPDDDDRLPRDRAVLGEDAPETTPAPIVRVSAAPSASVAKPVAPPAVVQGFGGEIAVPSSAATDRPRGTRRRNHPSNWQPESAVTPPEPLEEREAITEAAVSPAVLPEIYDRDGRLVMPAPLKGSHDVLVHQNVMASNDGLTRILDDADLDRMRAAHLLVSFPTSESLRLNEDLPYSRRVARPWTVAFATDIGHAFYGRFHQPIQVNSAVRTVHYQARLLMINGNAAGISGDAASPHLTGQAIDLAKRGMSQAQLAWMRGYLLSLMQARKIDVEEEFQQACFHVSVYRSYTVGRRVVHEYAQVHTPRPEPVQNSPTDDR